MHVALTKDHTVTALPKRINQSSVGRDDIAAGRSRACHALHAAMKSESRRPATAPSVMQRGAERC